jgi:hypothetical protein
MDKSILFLPGAGQQYVRVNKGYGMNVLSAEVAVKIKLRY